MPDLDDLLCSDIAGTASRSVQPPEFVTVAARGRRRRTRRRAVLAAACTLVVAAAGGITVDQVSHDAAPRPTAPRPTPHRLKTPAPDRKAVPTPEQVVADPDASVTDVVVAAEDPDVRAALWQVCLRRCRDRHAAIALTTDGFASRTLVPVRQGAYPYLAATGRHAFLVTNDGRHPYLLDTDGTRRRVTSPGPAAPVGAGEVLTHWNGGGDDYVAVDPATGSAHRVTVPAGTTEVQKDGSGRLQALVELRPGRTPSVAWSDDGGATWYEHQLTSTGRSIFELVPTAGDTMAVLVGSDGATVFPFEAVQQGTRDGASWRGFPQDSPPSAFVDGGAVLPDGRLMVNLELAKEGSQQGSGSGPRMGLFVSQGADWSRLRRVTPPVGSPGMAPQDARWLAGADLWLVGSTVGPGTATVYLAEGGGSRVWAAADGGRTWTELRVR